LLQKGQCRRYPGGLPDAEAFTSQEHAERESHGGLIIDDEH
jgi:hypothetical protein